MGAPRLGWTTSARLALLLGLVSVVLLSGCGERGDERAFIPGDPAREGIAAELDGVDYEVFITRQLNVRDPEDKQYYPGPPAPPGSGYYGVFVRACALEDLEGEVTTSGRINAVDIRDKEYEPLPLNPENVFAYREQPLRPGECLPNAASATSFGPTGGAMILFRIPFLDTENRPFELEIEGKPQGGRPPRIARFELDL
ncbi:MAG: hypothetical protein M3502_01085 [Actinomycetota bacterium]|jgi:hypothetical protein|nr:hypothetical protein [Actinomycetota bacterium]